MTQETYNFISILSSILAMLGIAYSIHFQKQKIESQDKVNADLKSLLDILNVERLKQINDWEKEAQNRVVESRISDFIKDQQPNLEKIAKPHINDMLASFKEAAKMATIELFPIVIGVLDEIPKDQRLKYIEDNFEFNKDFFIKYYQKQDDLLAEKK